MSILCLSLVTDCVISTVQVGILGNAADFYKDGQTATTLDSNLDRRQMMIAFDMRYGI